MKRAKTARPRPVTRTRTQEQAADDERRYADNRRIAGRQAFRFIMLRAHGCTGKDCASPEHEKDLSAEDGLMAVLMAMEVIPDPEAGAQSKAYHWGHA